MVDIYYNRTGANSFLCINEKNEAFLVDPSVSPDGGLIDHINKLNVKLVAILITHGHWDHIGTLEDFCKLNPGIPVYISEEEVEFLTNTDLNLSIEAQEGGYKVRVLDYMPDNLIKVYDGETLEIAGFKVDVILTPFHTRGSTCYEVTSEKALFAGDTLFFSTVGRTDLPTGNARQMEASLRKLKMLPDELKVYPGHGACTRLEREKKYNSYLKNI